MNDSDELPSIEDFLASQGKSLTITLTEHLEALRTFDGGLYATNADAALEGVDADDLLLIPIGIEQEDSPYCIAYYLPNNRLVRILPDYAFEVQIWEEVDEDDAIEEAIDS